MINKEITYKTIREEILDQKRCQFQLISISATVTSAVLAFAAATKVGALVYVAPMLLNNLSLVIILDKAITIQRKVGYLVMMETFGNRNDWRWESHLEEYRARPDPAYAASDSEKRKHSYVTNVSLMLICLNAFCALLFFFGPDASTLQSSLPGRLVGWMDIFVVVLLATGGVFAHLKRQSLVKGPNCSAAVHEKWKGIINRNAGAIEPERKEGTDQGQ